MAKNREKRVNKKTGSTVERQRGLARLLGVVVALVLIGMMGLMILSQFFDTQLLRLPREIVARIVTPIQNTFASGTDFLVDYFRTLKLRSNLEYEYGKMKERIDELTDQAMLVNQLQREIQVLTDLDDELKRNTNLNGIKANIIGRDTSNYTYTLTLDKGSNYGIENNMAVVYPGGLVGITYDVLENSAKVRGIIDTGCAVAGLIESNRDQGTVSGTLAIDGKNNCRMYYLTFTTLPRPGDMVVTSGFGLPLPKGIPIGKVRESTRGMEDSKQYIVLEPVVDFDHLEYVIVYRYRATSASAQRQLPDAAPTFVPLPSIKPVPTLIGQPEPEVSPDALTSPEPSETPQPSPTPGPEQLESPVPSTDEGYTYNAPVIVEMTPTIEPFDAPVTNSPEPTFSPGELTVEEDG